MRQAAKQVFLPSLALLLAVSLTFLGAGAAVTGGPPAPRSAPRLRIRPLNPPAKKNAAFWRRFSLSTHLFSHFWLATPQLVLQADWQDVWHSPQPPFFALSHRLRVSRVLILSMVILPSSRFSRRPAGTADY